MAPRDTERSSAARCLEGLCACDGPVGRLLQRPSARELCAAAAVLLLGRPAPPHRAVQHLLWPRIPAPAASKLPPGTLTLSITLTLSLSQSLTAGSQVGPVAPADPNGRLSRAVAQFLEQRQHVIVIASGTRIVMPHNVMRELVSTVNVLSWYSFIWALPNDQENTFMQVIGTNDGAPHVRHHDRVVVVVVVVVVFALVLVITRSDMMVTLVRWSSRRLDERTTQLAHGRLGQPAGAARTPIR